MDYEYEPPSDIPQELRTLLIAFDKTCASVLNQQALQLEEPTPTRLYHYTNGAGLEGILRTGKLRMTDVFNLNDPSELKYGLSYAIEAFKTMPQSPLLDRFIKDFESFGAEGIEAVGHIFVCCFSVDGDELGQWRAYADNGRGYAIGFDGPTLEKGFLKASEEKNASSSTFQMNYSETLLGDVQRKLAEAFLPLLLKPQGMGLSPDQLRSYIPELESRFSLYATLAASFSKHRAYTAEREYRFTNLYPFMQPPADQTYNMRSYSLLRYTEFDWKQYSPGALTEIVIGPAANLEVGRQFARDCLRAFGPTRETVAIRQSPIPYRVAST